MRYKGRELRQLFEVEIYVGDKDAVDPETKIETIVAWNGVDAIRRCAGDVVKQPIALAFVTWPEPGDSAEKVYIINDTSGPTDTEVTPSIALPTEEEDW